MKNRINNTFFHEFAHGLHYDKVGNNYWASYIAYIVAKGGYGNKNTSGSGRIAVGESWENFFGSTFIRTKYAAYRTTAGNYIRDFEGRALENQKRDDTIPYSFNGSESRGWIPAGFLHDCVDTGEPSSTLINDQVSGYTISGIFRGFNSGSDNPISLRNAILVNNGNSQSTQANTLMTNYGWQ